MLAFHKLWTWGKNYLSIVALQNFKSDMSCMDKHQKKKRKWGPKELQQMDTLRKYENLSTMSNQIKQHKEKE